MKCKTKTVKITLASQDFLVSLQKKDIKVLNDTIDALIFSGMGQLSVRRFFKKYGFLTDEEFDLLMADCGRCEVK